MGILAHRLAILTSASAELALPLASALAREGAALALVDADTVVAQAAADGLRGNEANIAGYRAAVSEPTIQSALEQIVGNQGMPDILVTLPSTPLVAPSLDLTEAAFRAALEANLVHAFLWSRAVGRAMVDARRGVIVHVTGLSGLGGWPGWLADSVAFGALHNLVHTLAVEWARSGVRVNALVPGVAETTRILIEQSPAAPDANQILGRIPVGRTATSDDIARALLYLVHPHSTFVSGEILRVDGGWDSWGRLHAVAARK